MFRRNSYVTALALIIISDNSGLGAPKHLKPLAGKIPANEWQAKHNSWQSKHLRQPRELKLQDRAQAAQEAAAKGAEIDVREDLTRNEKMVAKLAAGMTLQAIAEQHGISRERVRQIIKAIKHRNSVSHPFAKLGSHPFAKLGLSTRAWKALESDGITTVDVLCSKTQRELLRLPNFGLKSLNETIGALARIGRKLGDNPIAQAELAGTA